MPGRIVHDPLSPPRKTFLFIHLLLLVLLPVNRRPWLFKKRRGEKIDSQRMIENGFKELSISHEDDRIKISK